MLEIIGTLNREQKIKWKYRETRDIEDGIKVQFCLTYNRPINQRQVFSIVKSAISKNRIPWVVPGYKAWVFDLEEMKLTHPDLRSIGWFSGKVSIKPEVEFNGQRFIHNNTRLYDMALSFYMVPEVVVMQSAPTLFPVEIKESLEMFRRDYPNPNKVAFVMMRFGQTSAHQQIEAGIKGALKPSGIAAVRADEAEYHEDLYYNILTYMYGCGFGIAVFERIEADEFNPNVSLEVGYMMGLRKRVCFLKDKTLKTLHADLVGKLYRVFDPQNPVATISVELSQWLKDKGMI